MTDLPPFQNASRISVFGNNWQWRTGTEPVDEATDQQLSVGVDLDAGASPGMAFADRMVSLSGHDVALVPCAKGASSIEEWLPNYSWISLYGACLEASRRASGQGTIRGIIFWQGETDAMSEPDAKAWGRKFTQFAMAMRSDIRNPDLPIVFAQLGPDPTTQLARFPAWDEVQKQQWTMRGHHLSMIVTDDLPLFDELHIATLGMVTAGHRFADAMWALQQ